MARGGQSVAGGEEICIEDEAGRATPVNVPSALRTIGENLTAIRFLRDYEAGRITLTLDQYLHMPATLEEAIGLWWNSKPAND